MTTKRERGLDGLKVGDEVFVVYQLCAVGKGDTRWGKRNGEPHRRYVARVTKIGRKYAEDYHAGRG